MLPSFDSLALIHNPWTLCGRIYSKHTPHQCVKDVFEVHCVRHWYKSQSSHGLSHFLCVTLASEAPYHGSNEEDHLRAGSAGPLLSGGPLAHIRVRTLSSPWSLLQLDGAVCCWVPGKHFPDFHAMLMKTAQRTSPRGKAHTSFLDESQNRTEMAQAQATPKPWVHRQPAGLERALSKLVLWACRY